MLILLVDGDAERRASLCALLSRQRHMMLVAKNRTDAIAILRRAPTPPRLILLDPDCGGTDASTFLESVIHIAPDVKILPLAFGRALHCHETLTRLTAWSAER